MRTLFEHLGEEAVEGVEMRELSMGMSNDYQIAAREGATMVRIGTAPVSYTHLDVYKRQGLGREALELMKHFAFRTLGLERLEMEVHMENHATRKCYQKAGFVMEGVKLSLIHISPA